MGYFWEYLKFQDFLFVPSYQMMFLCFFDVFEGFYYVSAMFTGTKTGTILVLGVYIYNSTRGIVGRYVFFIDVLLAPLGAI